MVSIVAQRNDSNNNNNKNNNNNNLAQAQPTMALIKTE
jgi:hypothetical protein